MIPTPAAGFLRTPTSWNKWVPYNSLPFSNWCLESGAKASWIPTPGNWHCKERNEEEELAIQIGDRYIWLARSGSHAHSISKERLVKQIAGICLSWSERQMPELENSLHEGRRVQKLCDQNKDTQPPLPAPSFRKLLAIRRKLEYESQRKKKTRYDL